MLRSSCSARKRPRHPMENKLPPFKRALQTNNLWREALSRQQPIRVIKTNRCRQFIKNSTVHQQQLPKNNHLCNNKLSHHSHSNISSDSKSIPCRPLVLAICTQLTLTWSRIRTLLGPNSAAQCQTQQRRLHESVRWTSIK